MVFRRNLRKRNSRFRRKSTKAKWRRMKSRRINVKKAVYYYTRYCDYGDVNCDGLTSTELGYNFSLNDLPNYAEFTSLYDMYKINAVKLTFIPRQTVSNSTSSINNADNTARFFSAIDYNDSSVATADQLREYQTAKFTRLLRTHKRYIYKPKILDSNSYSVSPWMSTLSPSANYYGLKIAIEPTGSALIYGVEAKFYLSFKNVK